MIKLTRKQEPTVLLKNKDKWLQALNAAIAKHGSYKAIPQDEKEKLITHYRHNDIKTALIHSSNGKCAFCECIPSDGGNVEVEHFKPKSIYPENTFDWVNLLPACRKCNEFKADHDTVTEPIVNPYEYDPEDLFYYEDIRIKVKQCTDTRLGGKTIEVCGLDSVRLWKPRSAILVTLHEFDTALQEAINNYQQSDSERKKANRLRNLREAIERIEMLTNPDEKYSHFCKHFLKTSSSYKEAKKLLDQTII